MSKLLKEKSNNQCAEWSRKFFAAVLDCPVPEFTDYIKDNEAAPSPTHKRARAHTHTTHILTRAPPPHQSAAAETASTASLPHQCVQPVVAITPQPATVRAGAGVSCASLFHCGLARQEPKDGGKRSQTIVQKLSPADLKPGSADARSDTQTGIGSSAADLHAMAEKLHEQLEGLGTLPEGELQHKLTRSLITNNCLLMEKEKLEHDMVGMKVGGIRPLPPPL